MDFYLVDPGSIPKGVSWTIFLCCHSHPHNSGHQPLAKAEDGHTTPIVLIFLVCFVLVGTSD